LDRGFSKLSFGILYVVFPMDIHFQILMDLQRDMEAFQAKFQRDMEAIEEIRLAAHERYIRNIMDIDITGEYTQERYAWYDYEEDCEDWYKDSCNLWDDNYFYLLFTDSTPHYVEHIMESSQELSLNTYFQYSPVLVCYPDDFLDMDGSIYLDPHDQCNSLEHPFRLVFEFQYLKCGVHMSTWTWDPSLEWRLDYFDMVARISTWDLGSPAYCNTMVHTYPWDPGIWLCYRTMCTCLKP
jgi:hypothetical protein